MYTLRTRFANDIVTEFLPPSHATKKQRVIIFADGMPTVPNKKSLLKFFSKKGFWVFHPRYRGTWESDGKLFDKSPHLDIIDVINGIEENFVSIWDYNVNDKKPFKLNPDQIILAGSSFAGPAMLLASQDKRVNKVMVFAPVVDWTKTGKAEPLNLLEKFTKQAFGNGYRIAKNGWSKIASGKFYNPVHNASDINGSKIIIVHAKDDDIVTYAPVKKFSNKINAKLITLPKGGHLSSSLLLTARFYKIFQKFTKI